MKLFCSCTNKPVIRCQQRKRATTRTQKQKVNHMLTLGAALGAALRSDGRIRQGGLGRASCRRSGLVLDDHHLSLGPLRRPLGQSPEKESPGWIRSDARQDQQVEELQEQARESYSSSSSSSELSAERSKFGPPPARRGGGVGSLGRLAGTAAPARDDPAPVATAAGGAPAATVLAAVERVARRCGC